MRCDRSTPTARGFSLVEVLLVTIIIGLIAAVMIPRFLNQTEKADVAAARSLVRTASTAVEAVYVDTGDYAAVGAAALESAEPEIDFDGGGGLAANDAVTFAPAANGYTLSSTTGAGVTFTLTKDTTATPAVRRTDSEGGTW